MLSIEAPVNILYPGKELTKVGNPSSIKKYDFQVWLHFREQNDIDNNYVTISCKNSCR